MSIQDLLVEVEPLSNHARIRRVVELGLRAKSGDGSARTLLRELASGAEAYARHLAMYAAAAARDGALILERVTDPSRQVRKVAIRWVPFACDDEQVALALARVGGARSRAKLMMGLRKRGRLAPIDSFLASTLAAALAPPDPWLVDLVPLASPSFVEAHLSLLDRNGEEKSWHRLATHHPALAARAVLDRLGPSTTVDMRKAYLFLTTVVPLAKAAPNEARLVIEALLERGIELFHLHTALRTLLVRLPRETFDILRSYQNRTRPQVPPGPFQIARFDRVAHRLGSERLAFIVENASTVLSDGLRTKRWALRLGADDRKAVIDAWLHRGSHGWGAFLFRLVDPTGAQALLRKRAYQRWSCEAQTSNGTIPEALLDALPADLREKEARRHLFEIERIAQKPELRLPYARFLPFADAKAFLAPYLGHPEGEERARALSLLIAEAWHDRSALPEILDLCLARRFEQDPVRLAMASALAALPAHVLGPSHLPKIDAFVEQGLDAADLSPATAAALSLLVMRLFRVDRAFAAAKLVRILAVRGAVSRMDLGTELTEPDVRELSPLLSNLCSAWLNTERMSALILLATSLGTRLRVVTPLLEALARLARELPFVTVAATALDLLRRHDPKRFAALVPELISEDPSFVLVPAVAHHIGRARQDLLMGFLLRGPMTGRFATGRTHWVIEFPGAYHRWTPSQQNAYGAQLAALLSQPDRDVPTCRFSITILRALPFAIPPRLLEFAADPRPPVREMVIRALPWLDGGEGIPVLIEALGDDRARWAIYALRRAFYEMSRPEVLGILRNAPTTKVTVAKEVIRLLGEFGGAEGFETLLNMATPLAHRDVRIAALRALWDHLDRRETWDIFDMAVRDPDWIVATKLADIPLGRLTGDKESRVIRLLVRILARDEPDARLDLLKRVAYLPLTDADRALFNQLLAHTGTADPDEARLAFVAVFHRVGPSEVDRVVLRVKELLPRRDLCAVILPTALSMLGPHSPSHRLGVAEGIMSALEADPLLVPQLLEYAAKLRSSRDELAPVLRWIAERGLLHADAMAMALKAISAAVHPARLEHALAKEADPNLRRLGLEALIKAAAPKHGWTEERRRKLEEYRQDPAPLVAGAAAFVFPPK